METEKSPETSRVTENTYGQTETDNVKLVEMGSVSTETKGFVHGLELGLTPRN
jgi:hypothetical protein